MCHNARDLLSLGALCTPLGMHSSFSIKAVHASLDVPGFQPGDIMWWCVGGSLEYLGLAEVYAVSHRQFAHLQN